MFEAYITVCTCCVASIAVCTCYVLNATCGVVPQVRSGLVCDLLHGTQYQVQVRVRYQGSSWSGWSPAQTGSTLEKGTPEPQRTLFSGERNHRTGFPGERPWSALQPMDVS